MAPVPSASPQSPPSTTTPSAKRPKLTSSSTTPVAMTSPQQFSSQHGIQQFSIPQPQQIQPPQQQHQFVQQQYVQQPVQPSYQQQFHTQPSQHVQTQNQPPQPPPSQQHQQNQQQAANSMPPPTAPASKPTDPNDLADALTSAGIDLKEEEAQLASFCSGGSVPRPFNPDPYNGVPLSKEDARKLEVRRRAEMNINHANNPFLSFAGLSNVLLNKTLAQNCKPFTLSDPAGNISLSGQNADIITLLSLACRDRLNSLITRSIALAKARRRPQTHVTGEWADQVINGIRPESVISPRTGFLKRPFSNAIGQQPTTIHSGVTIPTVSLQNETAKALRALKQKEWELDQERQRKRARRELGITAGSSGAATPGGDSSAPGTPGVEVPPLGERRMSVKESRKHHASKIEEAASHRAANATANMMMGIFGGGKKKKKTYSWMNAGGVSPGNPSMGMGSVRQGSTGTAGLADQAVVQPSTGPDLGNINWTGQRLGVWREDGERGKGVQVRDWVGALEGDGRGSSGTVVKAYLRLK